MKFRYIERMHRELQRNAPEDFTVSVIREGRNLFTVISCYDRDYVSPWFIREIVEPYGFSTVIA